MSIDQFFHNASIVMTVVSLITFVGILLWVYVLKNKRDYERDANMLFDENDLEAQQNLRKHHG
ncbi:MAG: cbb3-type cytochrome c oxidase subunit 3 [Burkholderiaceae bacterium]|nr:cbb3-type cytochrome c oxidase subunit 3 [Burkholderiaceae bacterium]